MNTPKFIHSPEYLSCFGCLAIMNMLLGTSAVSSQVHEPLLGLYRGAALVGHGVHTNSALLGAAQLSPQMADPVYSIVSSQFWLLCMLAEVLCYQGFLFVCLILILVILG